MRAYVEATGVLALAMLATNALEPLLEPAVYPLFFFTILILAWRHGRNVGLYAAVLSTALADVAVAPQFAWAAHSVPRMAIFLLAAVPMVLMAARHRRALQAVRESEARLAGVIGSAMDAIISVDQRQRIVLFNAAAERAFRCTARDVLGEPLDRLIPVAVRGEHRRHLNDFAATEVISRRMEGARLTALRCDGTEFPIEATISQIRTPQGPVFTVILRDVTMREQAERAMRQSEKMEAVGRLAEGIAHDFNNMLQAIMGNASLLLTERDMSDNAMTSILEITNASSRAADLTRQLLVFGRRTQIQPHVFDVAQVVQGLRPMLRRLIPEHIELAIQVHQHCHVRADPGQLEQVVLNLVVNARDAMPDGGRVLVSVDTVENPPAHGAGCYCRLSVQDTGRGMDPAILGHIFEPFFTTKTEGTGLGLATVYAAVQNCDGHIDVHSEPEKGTTFEIFLPESRELMSTELTPTAPRASGPTARRVLVVEDEPMVRMVLTRMLRERGYYVVSASNGVEGLRVLAGEQVDVVLTDVVMPEMGGPAFARYMAEIYPELPVLFMSGYPAQGSPGQPHQQEPWPVDLQKPIDSQQLITQIERVLTKS